MFRFSALRFLTHLVGLDSIDPVDDDNVHGYRSPYADWQTNLPD